MGMSNKNPFITLVTKPGDYLLSGAKELLGLYTEKCKEAGIL